MEGNIEQVLSTDKTCVEHVEVDENGITADNELSNDVVPEVNVEKDINENVSEVHDTVESDSNQPFDDNETENSTVANSPRKESADTVEPEIVATEAASVSASTNDEHDVDEVEEKVEEAEAITPEETAISGETVQATSEANELEVENSEERMAAPSESETEELNPLQTSDHDEIDVAIEHEDEDFQVIDEDSQTDMEIVEEPTTKATIDVECDVKILNHDEVEEEQVDCTRRPKRSAALAADSKIKSLVLSSGTSVELETVNEPKLQVCAGCKKSVMCAFEANGTSYCSGDCFKSDTSVKQLSNIGEELTRLCAQCSKAVTLSGFLSWETFDFCKVDCLTEYQSALGSTCIRCKANVSAVSLGKYCVRFGHKIKQFCQSSCLEEHKAMLKICAFCQRDIFTTAAGLLALNRDKGRIKEFCSQTCLLKFKETQGQTFSPAVDSCAVCGQHKPVSVEVLVSPKSTHKLCSEPCLAAFKFVNDVSEGQCMECKKYFANAYSDKMTVFFDEKPFSFCGKSCLNMHIHKTRRAVVCVSCKVKKYNIDMIQRTNKDGPLPIMFCSATCLASYDKNGPGIPQSCEECKIVCIPQYKVLVENTLHLFCSFKCASNFQNVPGKNANQNGKCTETTTVATVTKIIQQLIVKPDAAEKGHNKSTFCKPLTHNMGTYCRPMVTEQETQTDASLTPQLIVPIPVPIYVPAPLHMYSSPYPVPIPFPLPIPVPIFIPTTRNSSKGILKEIRKIQDKMPTDPFEAELLMMAEMVAGDKKQDVTDSESDGEVNDSGVVGAGGEGGGVGGGGGGGGGVGAAAAGNAGSAAAPEHFSPDTVDTSNAFGEDMLQMALKMATELDEPAVDMEAVLTSSTITPNSQPTVDTKALYGAMAGASEDVAQSLSPMRGRKRSIRGGRGGVNSVAGVSPSKRGRRSVGPENTLQNISNIGNIQQQDMAQAQRLEVDKPDSHMRLKYTYGVNAWRHWVVQKNVELEKAMLRNRKIKPFKPDILQLTADELNFSLCLFVKEVKKPTGTEYAPDTIYYLCLGIQQYLFENGRIDNIFTDSFYEKFTECLDDVAKKFQVIYNDSRFIVTRVEEEHLWESKQLGAHSPHVLLSTLMFFNTKHFNLVTVEEHMQLSFSHIMKHWKRNPSSPGVTKVPGSRNVLLRFYPPQSALEANARKKKVYEQQENEENPLRCPVKLYEFYLSKCPESVKTRNDVFYLLPERSCVPDSPVWYSTMALGKEPLMKMLHRIKMVKEINIALLTS